MNDDEQVTAITAIVNEMEHDDEDLQGEDGIISDHLVVNGSYAYDERCFKCRLERVLES